MKILIIDKIPENPFSDVTGTVFGNGQYTGFIRGQQSILSKAIKIDLTPKDKPDSEGWWKFDGVIAEINEVIGWFEIGFCNGEFYVAEDDFRYPLGQWIGKWIKDPLPDILEQQIKQEEPDEKNKAIK